MLHFVHDVGRRSKAPLQALTDRIRTIAAAEWAPARAEHRQEPGVPGDRRARDDVPIDGHHLPFRKRQRIEVALERPVSRAQPAVRAAVDQAGHLVDRCALHEFRHRDVGLTQHREINRRILLDPARERWNHRSEQPETGRSHRSLHVRAEFQIPVDGRQRRPDENERLGQRARLTQPGDHVRRRPVQRAGLENHGGELLLRQVRHQVRHIERRERRCAGRVQLPEPTHRVFVGDVTGRIRRIDDDGLPIARAG